MEMVNKRKMRIWLLLLIFTFGYGRITKEADAMEIKNKKNIKITHTEQIPQEINECFTELSKKLTKDQLNEFKNSSENEIAKFHHSIGRWIRNNWQLWSSESSLAKFFNKRGISNPDDMSEVILISFHRYLNNKPIGFEQLIKSNIE